MSSSKKVNNLAKRVSSEYKQIINPSCDESNQTDNVIKDGCEQARHAEQTIKKQQISHDNLRNAMIIHEILSQPVCKRRKKR